jgi:hypothetical protein
MLLLSPKICRTHHNKRYTTGGHLAHWCPACKELHEIAVERPFNNGARWTFNGSYELPTFTPSMNIRIGPYPDGSKKAGKMDICHYFLREGQLIYLSDCTHALAGQTIPVPDLPQSVLDQIAKFANTKRPEDE